MDSTNPTKKIKQLQQVIKKIAQENSKMVELVEDFIKSSATQWPQEEWEPKRGPKVDRARQDTVDNHMRIQPRSKVWIDWRDHIQAKKTVDWPEEEKTVPTKSTVDWSDSIVWPEEWKASDWPEEEDDQDITDSRFNWPQVRKASDWPEEEEDITDWQETVELPKQIDWDQEKKQEKFKLPQRSYWPQVDIYKKSNYDQWRYKPTGSLDYDDDNSGDLGDSDSKYSFSVDYQQNHQADSERISVSDWPNWDQFDVKW